MVGQDVRRLMATIYGRKHTIRRGYLLVPQEMTGPGGKIYTVDLEYQVWDAETGRPVEDSRTVEGERHGDRLVVGDPHRDTRLYEYTIATQPTSESTDYWRGYQAALGDRQWHKEGQSKKYYANTQAWWDGYNQGHRDKRDPSAGHTPNMQTNPRKRAPFTDGPRGTERALTRLRRDQDLVQQQLELAHRQGNTKAIERLLEMERDLDRRVDEAAFEPNGQAQTFGLCEYCEDEWRRSPSTRKKDIATMLKYGRPQKLCGVCGDLAGSTVTVDPDTGELTEVPSELAPPTRLVGRGFRGTENEQLLMSFFRDHGPATAADALRAVPGAKRSNIDRLHRLRLLVSAPSPGRGNMLRVADNLEPNGGYYVWVLASDGTPKDEGPYGPKDLESAKTYARIAATSGAHDRAVSRGLDPKSSSFEVVRRYKRGTGERVI